jgi:hypothetical protein
MAYHLIIGEVEMPKLVVRETFGLLGVSQKPNKNGLFRLVRFKNRAFKNRAFNQPVRGSMIEQTLTDLTKSLYNFEEGSRWFEITGGKHKGETIRIEITDYECLLIPNIINKIIVGEWEYRFFIIVNGERTEYQWITAVLIGRAYTGCD